MIIFFLLLVYFTMNIQSDRCEVGFKIHTQGPREKAQWLEQTGDLESKSSALLLPAATGELET